MEYKETCCVFCHSEKFLNYNKSVVGVMVLCICDACLSKIIVGINASIMQKGANP